MRGVFRIVSEPSFTRNFKKIEKSCRKIWWNQIKAVPLHSQFRNEALKNAPLAQLVEQLTLNQWV